MKIRTTKIFNVICPECKRNGLIVDVGIKKPYFRAYCIFCEKQIYEWNPLGVI